MKKNIPSIPSAIGLLGALLVVGCSNSDNALEPDSQTTISPRPTTVVEYPMPFSERVEDIWTSPSGMTYAVGSYGNVARHDGSEWERMDSGVVHHLDVICGLDDETIIAVGDGACVIHFDGTTWTPVEFDFAGIVHDVFAVPGESINIVTDARLYSSRDGKTWGGGLDLGQFGLTRMRAGDSRSDDEIYLASRNTVYVLEQQGLFDLDPVPSSAPIQDLWCAPNGDIYVVSIDGGFRFDGNDWHAELPSNSLGKIHGSDAGEVFAVGGPFNLPEVWRRDSLSPSGVWSSIVQDVPISGQIRSLCVGADGTAFVGGFDGAVASYELGTWSNLHEESIGWLNGVVGAGPGDVYAFGRDGFIARFDGSNWSDVDHGLTTNFIREMWASGPNDVYAVTSSSEILHFDGSWQTVDTGLDVTGASLRFMSGSSPDNVYVAGRKLWHFDGTTWSDRTDLLESRVDDVSVDAIWVAPTGEAFVATNEGGFFIVDGTDVRTVHSTDVHWGDISGIWGTSATNVYMIHDDYYLMRWDGDKLRLELGVDEPADVWGTSPSNVFVISDGEPLLHHFNGQSWRTVALNAYVGGAQLGGFGGDLFATGFTTLIRIVQ